MCTPDGMMRACTHAGMCVGFRSLTARQAVVTRPCVCVCVCVSRAARACAVQHRQHPHTPSPAPQPCLYSQHRAAAAHSWGAPASQRTQNKHRPRLPTRAPRGAPHERPLCHAFPAPAIAPVCHTLAPHTRKQASSHQAHPAPTAVTPEHTHTTSKQGATRSAACTHVGKTTTATGCCAGWALAARATGTIGAPWRCCRAACTHTRVTASKEGHATHHLGTHARGSWSQAARCATRRSHGRLTRSHKRAHTHTHTHARARAPRLGHPAPATATRSDATTPPGQPPAHDLCAQTPHVPTPNTCRRAARARRRYLYSMCFAGSPASPAGGHCAARPDHPRPSRCQSNAVSGITPSPVHAAPLDTPSLTAAAPPFRLAHTHARTTAQAGKVDHQ
jgi:hypothetical protein